MPLAPLAQLTCPRLVCMWPLNTRNPFPCFVPACLRPTATCRRVVLAHLHRRQHWCRHIPSAMVCNKDVVGSGSPPDPECRLDDTYTPPGTCGQHTGGGTGSVHAMLHAAAGPGGRTSGERRVPCHVCNNASARLVSCFRQRAGGCNASSAGGVPGRLRPWPRKVGRSSLDTECRLDDTYTPPGTCGRNNLRPATLGCSPAAGALQAAAAP